jgi:hypothetical protein
MGVHTPSVLPSALRVRLRRVTLPVIDRYHRQPSTQCA